MNYNEACQILELSDPFTQASLKTQYKRMALIYHPDKNASVDATKQFQRIREAYDVLQGEDCKEHDYVSILRSFINENILKEGSILTIILQLCETKSLSIFEKLDKKIMMMIYKIVKENQCSFHLPNEFLDKMRECIKCERIILNPSLTDLFENNLYKLEINGMCHVVPLWHHQLVYDNSGCDIYVECVPELPDHITIDEYNNIHVSLMFSAVDVWQTGEVAFNLGDRQYLVMRNEILMADKQTIILKKQGISKIMNQIYDITAKSDVMVSLNLI